MQGGSSLCPGTVSCDVIMSDDVWDNLKRIGELKVDHRLSMAPIDNSIDQLLLNGNSLAATFLT